MQYTSIPSVCSDQVSLRLYPCAAEPKSLVVWIHGGGWVKGDRRRTRNMPSFFNENDILFVSINYPLEVPKDESLIDLQILALQGLNNWLTSNPILETYSHAFDNIVILAHSSGAHLTALFDKQFGWNNAVKCLFLMDSGAYDMQARFRASPPQQKRKFIQIFGLNRYSTQEYNSILRSYSPALLSPRQRSSNLLRVIIVTSQRRGAIYSAEKLQQSYLAPGYIVSIVQYNWDHEVFTDAIGSDPDLNHLLLQAISA